MGARKYRDLVIRGVTYATAQDAARALGVQEQTVQIAARNGTLDRCGLGEHFPVPMPIRIRGRDYASAREAARILRVPIKTIYTALARGAIDRVGMKRSYNGAKSETFVIGGMVFPSLAAAGRALGFSSEYVSLARRRKSAAMQQKIMAAAMRLQAEREAEAIRLRHLVAA